MMLRLILISLLGASLNLCYAQNIDSLSAKAAVVIALKNNYSVQIGEAQKEISKKNNKWSEAGLFPTVDLNLGLNTSIQDNTNNPFTFTPGVILSTNLSPNLSLNMNLFSGMAVRISKQRLEQLEAQSNGNASSVMESTALDVLKAYYQAVAQGDKLKILNQIKENSFNRFKFYDVKRTIGTASSLEELQFKNLYFTDSINEKIQNTSYENSLRNLYLLMNVKFDPLAPPILSDGLWVDFPIIDFKQALSSLPNTNQDLKNQYLAVELQRTNTAFQQSFLYPTLGLQAGVTPARSWFRDLNDESLKVSTEVLMYNGGLNLRYNLFNNWKYKRAVQASKIQESIANMSYNQLKTSLESNLATLINIYKNNSNLVALSELNLTYAKQAWFIAQKRFDLGSLNSVELVNFKNNYENQSLQLYDFELSKINTYLEIYKMTGKLKLDYIKP
jgi:outer membrane protein TolC